ncbi:putative iron-regulated membrane protein [Sphingobium sp. OAS761]|uniref:PepSY-associated TM helix domain-containing protein n=1 Tax=Sphingobium sp. OAS761 TaxID=2817901 RepID=UPI00209E187D|nr:PepSY domain-containing protein [Sphingobium sp. OAS761]MCP1472121.1 putative iron-regulated membrane protein [Sphingobium sp. OAS761]
MAGHARRLWRSIHLWLGLTVGLLFVLLGLTGSALVFYVEIDALLHPATQVESSAPAPDWSSQAWDRALATVRTQWPQDRGAWRFEASDKPGAIHARYYPPRRSAGTPMAAVRMLWLSPDGERVLRQDRWGAYAMTWLYDLHMELLTGETGRRFVGWSGIAMLMLLASGLAAWWPRGSWRKAIAFKRHAVPIRRLHDLHKLTGLGSGALLLVLTLTGVMLALPSESNWVLGRMIAPVDHVPMPQVRSEGRQPISIRQALAVAHHALPQARLAWIEAPGPTGGAFRIRVQVPGDPSRRFPHSYVHVDPYSGAVLAVLDARRGNAATTINNWLHPLHDASIGGLSTRILACLAGLAPAALFLSGVLRWRRRIAARRRGPTAD